MRGNTVLTQLHARRLSVDKQTANSVFQFSLPLSQQGTRLIDISLQIMCANSVGEINALIAN